MKFKHLATASFCGILAAACAGGTTQTKEIGLKDVVGNKFLVGAALNVRQSSGADTSSLKIVKRHFNSIVAENCMKSEEIQPREGEFFFDEADKFVNFGIENNMSIIGHCLIWHSQCPDWFFTDDKGNNVSPEILRQRMKTHISTVVGRYKGKIKGWDVVNEAIVEDGSYRKSKFYEILGEEFIPLAFQYAHEADPDAELYYNDYGMNVKGRREGVVKLIRSLKEKGLRIDAVGMQGHMGMDYPDIKEFEESMLAFAAEGVKVMITEWDMSALPTARQSANISDTVAFRKSLNPYPDALPDSVNTAWNKRMDEFFTLFEKHSDIVTRVTAWGVSDGDSWKNDFPVRGRKDYPLLFDRNYQPKDFIRKMIEEKDNN
ncbi:endo-1,4-beta-xylanase [uncultured Bacteroides sp.]|uniref:endo-1,4-beta-xylanase n=1 Tax=uncultured Bacteroides sp. TaxID=162156 RepID=UPI00262A7F7B|nr:endo-1,4-beta-xylanase [uncultured Bacteroides sp.]